MALGRVLQSPHRLNEGGGKERAVLRGSRRRVSPQGLSLWGSRHLRSQDGWDLKGCAVPGREARGVDAAQGGWAGSSPASVSSNHMIKSSLARCEATKQMSLDLVLRVDRRWRGVIPSTVKSPRSAWWQASG